MEEMRAFFEARVECYDQVHVGHTDGHGESYRVFPYYLPAGLNTLLDLGCGTGLELEGIYKRFPDIQVTGIDLSAAMLKKLWEKYAAKEPVLLEGDYFSCPFGENFDAVISFMTLHHFNHQDKTLLYQKVLKALRPGGVYAECDYMAPDQAYEDRGFERYRRQLAEMGLAFDGPDYVSGEFHCDTPCTVENQRKMLEKAGFIQVRARWQLGNTVIMTALKE